MSGFSGRAGVLAMLVVLLVGARARGHDEVLEYTAFATINVKPPLITGSIWLNYGDGALGSLYPADRDYDGQFTTPELWDIRYYIRDYLNERFLLMWQGGIHKVEVESLAVVKRPGIAHTFLKIGFVARDLPPGVPIEIASRLMHNFFRKARCVALITRGGRREVFVLGMRDYYRSDRSESVAARDGIYRPRSQRGRVAISGDLVLEMLYAMPEGTFNLYVLEKNRETPRAIEAEPIKASIRPGKDGTPAPVVLEPKPLSVDKAGRCSRFVGTGRQFKQGGATTFSVDMTFGAGKDRRRVVFDFPAVTVPAGQATSKPAPRYACPELCLGVECKDKARTCMRCGSGLVEVRGAPVPGVGNLGRHGGQLKKLAESGLLLEALLPDNRELRLYLTDEAMAPRAVGKITGKALLWTEQQLEETQEQIDLASAEDGLYLFAKIPLQVTMPLVARCAMVLGEGRPPVVVTFHLHESLHPDK